MNTATIKLGIDPDISNIINRSLMPELQREGLTTSVNITAAPDGLIITIETEELSNLRAALNSYMRWINCINSINDVISRNL